MGDTAQDSGLSNIGGGWVGGWVGVWVGFLQEIMPLRGSILQAGTCQILSLAENPRWSRVWQQQISVINDLQFYQVLKLGFRINSNNKTKTLKTITTIYHLLLTQFWPNCKVRCAWLTRITTTTFLGYDSIELNLVLINSNINVTTKWKFWQPFEILRFSLPTTIIHE